MRPCLSGREGRGGLTVRWMRARRSLGFPAASRRPEVPVGTLGGQLGVARRGETPAQVLEDVEGQAADQRDDGHLPQERHRGDEVDVWHGMRRDERRGDCQVETRSDSLLSRRCKPVVSYLFSESE